MKTEIERGIVHVRPPGKGIGVQVRLPSQWEGITYFRTWAYLRTWTATSTIILVPLG